MKNQIQFKNISKHFGDEAIFDHFSLPIEVGRITTLFGPNGCGKSTLLNIVNGLIPPDTGEVIYPTKSNFQVSYVFQNYRDTLLPWRNGMQNITLPFEIKRTKANEQKAFVTDLLDLFGDTLDLSRYSYQLSGGQQQLLVLMRALATKPNLLYIDEPFSALDYETNLRLRQILQGYYAMYHPTIVIITHNLEEAIHLGSKIVILSRKPTRIIQTICNHAPYPRNATFLHSNSFLRIKTQVIQAFHQAVGGPDETV